MKEVWNNPALLKNIMADVLQDALSLGASSAEVDLNVNRGFTVTARNQEAESVEYNQDRILEITVYFGQRLGSASLSDFRPASIRAAIDAACHIARFTDQDPCAGIADKKHLSSTYPDLDLNHPWSLTVEQAIDLAVTCEKEALAKDSRLVNSEGVSISTTEGWHAYSNSNGFVGCYPASSHEVSCVLIAKQGEDMQRDYDYSVACDPQKLTPMSKIASTAAERTLSRLGARSLSTRQVPVIFAADRARSLLGHFAAAIAGGNLYRKASFLIDRIGTRVFPKHITIDQRPHLLHDLGSAPFDDDGVITRPNVFIQEGILNMYSLGTYSARKLGLETTGNSGGVFNLFINTGDKDLAALLKHMGTGLLVTDLMGQGVNLLTGDYSRGATGFWIENGEIQYPVEEITIAGNLNDIYAQIVEVGNDVDWRGNIKTGSILIGNMMVAGG
ncbi:MAG: metalloprotease PmbA [Gammaproteobacteria bacterium]|nr:metalloprotease PmbA [Gammaproteobacteria bacterium]